MLSMKVKIQTGGSKTFFKKVSHSIEYSIYPCVILQNTICVKLSCKKKLVKSHADKNSNARYVKLDTMYTNAMWIPTYFLSNLSNIVIHTYIQLIPC